MQLTIIGEKLLAALTHAEIERLLNALWAESSGQWEGAMARPSKGIAHLSPDTQATIRQLITQPLPDHSTPDQEAPIAIAQRSHTKLSQIWSELWQEWWALVTEASEEDGRYIQQEASWEPPYFDDYAFAEDLDAVAAKMRWRSLPRESHLPSAFEQGLVPEEGFWLSMIVLTGKRCLKPLQISLLTHRQTLRQIKLYFNLGEPTLCNGQRLIVAGGMVMPPAQNQDGCIGSSIALQSLKKALSGFKRKWLNG
jgi:hypothetical protein